MGRAYYRRGWPLSFIRAVSRVDKSPVALKMRLEVRAGLFVQVYVNVATGTQNMVLVLGGQRIYGRDCIGGQWHRHPYEDPDMHDTSPEGSRVATVAEFLAEVQEILEKAELL